MKKENQANLNRITHSILEVEEIVMMRSHRQHQFHNDENQRIMDANTRQSAISLHVPPFFQDRQNFSD